MISVTQINKSKDGFKILHNWVRHFGNDQMTGKYQTL
jgi:hypothetical protein